MANWFGSWLKTDSEKYTPSEEVQRKTDAKFEPIRRELNQANGKLDDIERRKTEQCGRILSGISKTLDKSHIDQ